MTEKERRVVEKLKALIADTPYKGEKETAIRVLKNYCLKHNISEADLDGVEIREFTYELGDQDSHNIFICVSFHYFKKNKRIVNIAELDAVESFWHRRGQRNSNFVKLLCSPGDFAALIAEFEIYKVAFKKQLKKWLAKQKFKFEKAFLDKHDLLIPVEAVKRIGESGPPDPGYLLEDLAYIDTLKDVEKVEIYKQIEQKRGQNHG